MEHFVFRLLDYIEDRILFISLSLLLRILESIGESFAIVSGFSLTAVVFPKDVFTIFVRAAK